MKKIIALVLVALLTLSLSACGEKKEQVSSTGGDISEVASVNDVASSEVNKTNSVASVESKVESTASNTNSTASKTPSATDEELEQPIKTQSNIDANVAFSVKKGESISQNIDLKGKTITMAITGEGQYNTESFNRTVAIAWDIFRSKYEDGKSDSNAMSKKDKEYVNSLISGNIVCEPASLQDSDNNTNSLGAYYIMPGIRNGADVSKTVNDYKDKITACIKFALNQ